MLTFAIFGNFMFPNYVEKISRCFIFAYFSISLEKSCSKLRFGLEKLNCGFSSLLMKRHHKTIFFG